MKKILKNRIILSTLCLSLLAMVSACSDWTDTEGLDIKNPTIQDQNPELYAQYLANLNFYKQQNHKVLYVSFDNSEKTPSSRAMHIDCLPDSVDIISLTSPVLIGRELSQIENVHAKGTKVVYTISYLDIEAQYKLDKKAFDSAQENPVEGAEPPQFMDFDVYLVKQLDAQFALSSNYDGVTVGYVGKLMTTMTEQEKAAYIASQDIFFSKVKAWGAANSTKMLIFEGLPQNVIEPSVLSLCKYIILPTQNVKTANALSQQTLMALAPGVPSNNIIVATVPFSTDKSDLKTGYYTDGKSAILEAATWVAVESGSFTKAGLAIYGVQSDYYNTSLVYKYTREAIYTMNPSPKN